MLSVGYWAQRDPHRMTECCRQTNGKMNLKTKDVMTFSRVNAEGKHEKECMSFPDLGSFTQGVFSL